MVCEKCQKKLGTIATQDVWKEGATNTVESGGRKIGENKLLSAKKTRYQPYGGSGSKSAKPGASGSQFARCRICRSTTHQKGANYCQGCAYKKGICAMCGKKMVELKNYKQTAV